MKTESLLKKLVLGLMLTSGAFLLSACEEDDAGNGGGGDTTDAFQFNLDIPDALTGGTNDTTQKALVRAVSTGAPCAFIGIDDNNDNPFANGYVMTQFMTSVVATWTCIADGAITIVDQLPHDGEIKEGENDFASDNYDPEEPTHFSVTDDSETQTTLRVYWGYDRNAPPTNETAPGMFISWVEQENGDIEGRLIIEAGKINGKEQMEDPDRMRMDFSITSEQKYVNMYLQFDENPWADGFRIELTKDLTGAKPAFLVRGLMDMNRQFLPNVTSGDLPDLSMYTVSDNLGNGAAMADLNNIALPLELSEISHLGEYVFDNHDVYFFEFDEDWEWIDKTIMNAEYRGLRDMPAEGSDLNPSLDDVEAFLDLAPDYFDTTCNDVEPNCDAMLNAIFEKGFADQEQEQGENPKDWRSDALAAAEYLQSVYPAGFMDWQGVFEPVYTP